MNDIFKFNCCCSDGDFEYVKEHLNKLLPSQIELGLCLASQNAHIEIISYILDSKKLNKKSRNFLDQLDEVFMSSFNTNKKSNKVTEYLIKERNYIPSDDILCWIYKNNIQFKM